MMLKQVLGAAVLAGAVCAGSADAAVIYRETYGHNQSSNQLLGGFGWAYHVGTGAKFDTGVAASNGTGKPSSAAAVANINAGNPTTAYSGGYYWGSTAGAGTGDAQTRRTLVWTPEYSLDPADYQAGSLQFSWYQGNGSATGNQWRVAIQIGSQWYASDAAFGNVAAVTSGGNFYRGDDDGNGDAGGHGAELKTFTFTSAASAWHLLTFDGSLTANGTALSMDGTTLAADLPGGAISAFGLYVDNPTNTTRRFDTFTIAGTPVPEPATLSLGLLASGLLVRRRRR